MDDRRQFEGAADQSGPPIALARWLQRVMAPPGEAAQERPVEAGSEQLQLLHDGGEHLRFYQQIPDFAFALIHNDPQLTIRYASLLYHLIGCTTCHNAYLETYSALRAALQIPAEPLDTGPAALPLATVPPRALVHLCQSLIRQAELLLHQDRLSEESDHTESARALLQQAVRISAHMTQMRGRALQDLVRVAALFARPEEEQRRGPALHAYSLQLAGSGVRHGGKTLRKGGRAGAPVERPTIFVQSGSLEGSVTQQGDTLELHLHDLEPALRGRHVLISLPLALIMEPVRWSGGNPYAIRSATPVDQEGGVSIPLGQTALRLEKPEERNILEVMFLRLEVRAAE